MQAPSQFLFGSDLFPPFQPAKLHSRRGNLHPEAAVKHVPSYEAFHPILFPARLALPFIIFSLEKLRINFTSILCFAPAEGEIIWFAFDYQLFLAAARRTFDWYYVSWMLFAYK